MKYYYTAMGMAIVYARTKKMNILLVINEILLHCNGGGNILC